MNNPETHETLSSWHRRKTTQTKKYNTENKTEQNNDYIKPGFNAMLRKEFKNKVDALYNMYICIYLVSEWMMIVV